MGQTAEPGELLTLEEWADLDEDVGGELIDGRLEEEEVPTFVHEAIVAFLIRALEAYVEPRGALVVGSEAKLAVGPRRGRKADAATWLPGRPRPRGSDSIARVPPDVAIEVISPRPRDARRDRVEKRADYARAGVRWYWLVDPDARTLEILVRDGDRWLAALAVSEGTVEVPGIDGLRLDLDAMWARLDALDTDSGSDNGHEED